MQLKYEMDSLVRRAHHTSVCLLLPDLHEEENRTTSGKGEMSKSNGIKPSASGQCNSERDRYLSVARWEWTTTAIPICGVLYDTGWKSAQPHLELTANLT